jgi:DNA segregation ATPase FtsK/SpoIIIE-like protein
VAEDERLQDQEVLELAEKLYKKYGVLTAGMLQRDYKIGYARARFAVDSVLRPVRPVKEKRL